MDLTCHVASTFISHIHKVFLCINHTRSQISNKATFHYKSGPEQTGF